MKEVISVIVLLAFGQGIFLAVALVCSRRNRHSNIFYSILLILLSGELFYYYLYLSKDFISYPVELTLDSLSFLYGPLFFTYASSMTDNSFSLKKSCRHLIPFVCASIAGASFCFLPEKTKEELLRQFYSGTISMKDRFLLILMYTTNLIYLIITSWKVVMYSREVKKGCSNEAATNFNWLMKITAILFLFWLISLAANLLSFIGPPFYDTAELIYFIFIYIVVILIYFQDTWR